MADREPLEFALLLTIAAPTIPDDLFARLRERFGDKQVAAMVLLAAYGNFQDRIVLGLNSAGRAGRAAASARGQVRAGRIPGDTAPAVPGRAPGIAPVG